MVGGCRKYLYYVTVVSVCLSSTVEGATYYNQSYNSLQDSFSPVRKHGFQIPEIPQNRSLNNRKSKRIKAHICRKLCLAMIGELALTVLKPEIIIFVCSISIIYSNQIRKRDLPNYKWGDWSVLHSVWLIDTITISHFNFHTCLSIQNLWIVGVSALLLEDWRKETVHQDSVNNIVAYETRKESSNFHFSLL